MKTRYAGARWLILVTLLSGFCAAYAGQNDPTSSSPLTEESPSDNQQEKVRFSGFARLVGGYLNDEHASYQGYDDSISFGQHSLLALQTDVELSEQLSFTTQLLAHTSDARDSGFEWAYLTYRPSERWQFKAGKLRTPFFIYSDIIDVGFAYPWVTPPQQVYNPYLFSNFTGISAAYQFNLGNWGVETEAYWGNFDDDITVDVEPVDTEVDDLHGAILEVYRGNLRMRTSFHQGDVNVTLAPLLGLADVLREAGFERSADSLIPRGEVEFLQAALSYDTLEYFVKTEWMRLTSDTFAVPEITSYYLSGGYTFYPFTVHATFSDLTTDDVRAVNEIPFGVAPEIDALGLAYNQTIDGVLNDNLQSLSVGIRYDFSPSIALKAEWIHLDGDRDQRSFFTFDPAADFDRRANLVLFAVDWIF